MIRAVLLCCLICPLGTNYAIEIHVAPRGDDAHEGSADQPVASLKRAQQLVRGVLRSGSQGPLEVVIHSGFYELAGPLVLTPEDSGTEDSPVIWRAADPQQRPILSAGTRLNGKWNRSDKPNVWYVELPATRMGKTSDWNFRQLFVDDQRATRARFPNKSESNPYIYATGGGLDHATMEPKLMKEAWGSEQDAQINLVVHWLFFNQWNTIAAIDKRLGKLTFTDQERHGVVNSNPSRRNWFWIEGVFAELDEPGEWYLDRKLGRLYYMPEPGKDPNAMCVVAPRLDRIIHLKGDVDAGTHVEHVHFEDLDFRHTTFTLGHIAPRVHTDSAIRLENTKHCSIRNCSFQNIGGYACWLHLDSQHNVFDRNTVIDSGGGGVLLTGARLSYMDDSKIYTPGEAAAKVAPILNRITRNTVKHCGRLRYYGGGVHLDSRPANMAMMPGNYIAHNHFADLSRNGIFAFRNQGGNIVEYNHIHDAMQTTIDGGCIHFATMNHLNAPNYIRNNWLYNIWGYQQMPNGKPLRHHYNNAIFLDWDTSNTTVRDNYAYNSAGQPFKAIWDNWNLVQQGNVYSETVIEPPYVDQVGPDGASSGDVDLESNRLIGRVVHYREEHLVKQAGHWTPKKLRGMGGLFHYHQLLATQEEPAEISFTMPIEQAGTYQVSLLYKPSATNASNAQVLVHHADGIEEIRWDMQKGHKHGFAVEIGTFSFEPGKPSKVVLTNDQADGLVIADSVAYVLQTEAP